jgi:hypothetical protein
MGNEDSKIQPGCYYPGCDDAHGPRDKFCPRHGGRFAAHWDDEKVVRGGR